MQPAKFMKAAILVFMSSLFAVPHAIGQANTKLLVYGPGGPAPAMKERRRYSSKKPGHRLRSRPGRRPNGSKRRKATRT